VPQVETRLEEARAHGFTRALVASHDAKKLPQVRGIETLPVATLRDAMRAAFSIAGSGRA
jgi:predicted ATP-dependent serine protease